MMAGKDNGFEWCDRMQRVSVKLDQGSMYPMLASHPEDDSNSSRNYSFYFRPVKSRPMFLEPIARELGCEPSKHYRLLINGKTVTLENGTVVTPDMVMGEVKQ